MSERSTRGVLRRRLLPPLVIVAGVPVALSAGTLVAAQSLDPVPTGAVRETSAIACPSLSTTGAQLSATASGGSRVGLVIDGSASLLTVPVTRDVASGTIVLTPVSGGGQPAGAVWRQAGGVTTWGDCTTADVASIVLLPDATRSDVMLVNPDSTDAVVNVGLTGSSGSISAAGVAGITVPARGSRVVPVSVLAPGGHPVAVTVSATTGRVAAFGRVPGEIVPQVDAATSLTVPALPTGADHTTLVLSNPSSERATIQVTGLTNAGPFALAGASGVSVPAGTTQALDLSGSVRGESMGLAISSDRPIAATVVSGSRGPAPIGVLPGATAPDVAAVPAEDLPSAGVSLHGLVPGGSLTVVNPSARAASVTVSVRNAVASTPSSLGRTVAAGSLWSMALPASETEVAITSGTPVAADVVVSAGANGYGAKGYAVAVLPSIGGTSQTVGLRQDPSLR